MAVRASGRAARRARAGLHRPRAAGLAVHPGRGPLLARGHGEPHAHQRGDMPVPDLPPGFHTMIAIISRLSGLKPLEMFPVLGPALVVLPALVLYSLARRLWGREYGVAAACLTVILGGTYYYNDTMYPNLVTSRFLLVLAVAALCALYSSPGSPARPARLLGRPLPPGGEHVSGGAARARGHPLRTAPVAA